MLLERVPGRLCALEILLEKFRCKPLRGVTWYPNSVALRVLGLRQTILARLSLRGLKAED